MTTVCLDTNVLGLAIRKVNPGSSAELISRAGQFVLWLVHQPVQVIIPTIVIGEILTVVPPEEQGEVLGKIHRDWMTVSFDAKASVVFARMFGDGERKRLMRELQNGTTSTRAKLKADLLIIATARAHGATTVYTHNIKDMKKLAGEAISVADFMDVNLQTRFDW